MKNQPKIQRVELSDYGDALYCPFCGALAHQSDENWESDVEPCKHVLFIAHDEGFEHRSDRFNELMNIVGIDDDEIEMPKHGIDGLTDSVPLTGAVKFCSYISAPSFFGVYIGFAPTDED